MGTNSQKLPAELQYQIIHTAVVNSIHSIGTSCGTQWDVRIFTTLACVSPVFGAITRGIVGNVFGLADRGGTRNIIISAEKLMHEFHQLSEPEEWPEIARNYPEQYPSHIFNAYALLNCAIRLRRSAVELSSVPTFLATQAAAKTALRQVKLWPIETPEIVTLLYSHTARELDLVVEGTALVRSCIQVGELLDQIPIDRSHKPPISDETNGPLSIPSQRGQAVVKYAELHRLLRIIQTSATKFNQGDTSFESTRLGAAQLPGVAQTLHRVFSMFRDTQSPLDSTINDLLSPLMNSARSFLTGVDFGYPIALSFIY